MSPLVKSVLIFLGAGVGGNLRYWVGGWISTWAGPAFPWGTLVVNLSGSLLIGIAVGVLLQQQDPLAWRLLILVGLLGGFTTFSAFSFETLSLISDRSYGPAVANVLASCVAGLTATWLGLVIARILTER